MRLTSPASYRIIRRVISNIILHNLFINLFFPYFISKFDQHLPSLWDTKASIINTKIGNEVTSPQQSLNPIKWFILIYIIHTILSSVILYLYHRKPHVQKKQKLHLFAVENSWISIFDIRHITNVKNSTLSKTKLKNEIVP